jgi:hypothetical protein
MSPCEAAARQEFEKGYQLNPQFWLVRNADQSYKIQETQEAWTIFFKGWCAGFAWNPDKES